VVLSLPPAGKKQIGMVFADLSFLVIARPESLPLQLRSGQALSEAEWVAI